MKKLKNYVTRGTGSASIAICTGKDKEGKPIVKQINFTKGQKRPYLRKSYFITDDEVIQKGIESLPRFKKGHIKIKSSVNAKAEEKVAKKTNIAIVKTWQAAAVNLVSQFPELGEVDLNEPDAIRAKALEKGLTYTNIPDW